MIDPIVAVENSPHPAMIGIDGIEMMTERASIDEEGIPEEVSMTCLTVTKNPAEAGGEGLTVILRVPAAEETQRFVAPFNTKHLFK